MSSNVLIKVMVVDDHPVVREWLRVALNGSCGMEVVGEARDGVEEVRMAADIIVMDGTLGVDACQETKELMPMAHSYASFVDVCHGL